MATIQERRNNLVVAINRAGIIGAVEAGYIDALVDDGETGDPRGQIKYRYQSGNSYSPNQNDKDTIVIFDAPDVAVTFGSQDPGTSDTAWFSMLVNKGGSLTLNGTIIGYAPHADKNVTIGIIRTASEWIVSGTNIPEDLA